MKKLSVIAGMIMAGASAMPGFAQAPDGAAVYEASCAACHTNPALDSRAIPRELLAQFAPETILTALTTGNMFRQGSALTDAERRAVAGYIAGRPVGTPLPPTTVGRCRAAPRSLTAADLASGWNGWGVDPRNTRFASAATGGVTAAMVPEFKLKWAFGLPGVSSARAQPAVIGGRVFVASESGDVYALDAATGCTYWTFHAQAGIRTAVSVGLRGAQDQASQFAVFVADGAAHVYAIDAANGELIWTRRVDDHPYAKSTGSLTLYDGVVYVPTAGVGEEGQGGTPTYPCCTFRGSVTALDAATGELIWKSYTLPELERRGTSSAGVPLWGPAGAGVWSAPTVDAERGQVYVATGNGYAEPAEATTDAVIAFDLKTGALKWSFQPLVGDVWAGGCGRENPDNPNCPEQGGPDLDFSQSPVLARRSSGEDILIVQQKSGMAYAIEPDDGSLVWQYRTSEGSGLGGQWGTAVDASHAYFGVNGPRNAAGGVRAVSIDTGEELWSQSAEDPLCAGAPACSTGQGAAVSAIPGVVFAGSMDGGLRAYASGTGRIIWRFDTNGEFETVNGVPAHGGAIDGPGPVVSEGMLFINSGYISLVGRPGNVLLAFGVD
jgi:polyvinyl alcohol dehydrogenase (cytochrome)